MTVHMLPAYKQVSMQLFRDLNTPVALSCAMLLKYGEFDQLVNKTCDPSLYLDCPFGVERYRRDCQAVSFLRKSPDVPSSYDRKAAALEKFYIAEKKCSETNYLLECLSLGLGSDDPLVQRALSILARARKTIKRILGPLPARLNGRFGKGTCFELEGAASKTLADKLHIVPGVTAGALPVWEHTACDHHWYVRRLQLGLPHHQIVRGNRFSTVPKDAKVDRGICVEPLGNLYAQLGVGSYIKRRLSGVGLFVQRESRPLSPIELLLHRPGPNGQTIHRVLAREASVDGSWATIDLSDASDTVSYQLVKELLPTDWFALLDSLRSPFTKLPCGKWVKLDKFSSMGNGFTFELETLIFAALSSAEVGIIGVDVLVYGDDILIPRERARDVMAILSFFGFVPNLRKSYHTGLFRESCGGDFFCGEDVRAVYSTGVPTGPVEWFSLHNALRRKYPWFKRTLSVIRQQVPTRYRVFGPSRAGDIVLHTNKNHLWRRYWITKSDRTQLLDPSDNDGISRITGIGVIPTKIPLDRWTSEFVVSLALLGVASDGIAPRNAEPFGWRYISYSIS